MYLLDLLQKRQIWHESLLHRPSPTASGRARSLHVPGRIVAKSVLLRAGETGPFFLAVVPATARVDLAGVSQLLGGEAVRLATEGEVCDLFGDCERGALPPFGHLYGIETIVDVSLTEQSELVVMGNQRHEGVRLRYQDYESVATPRRAKIAEFTGTAATLGHRRAG